MTALIPHETPCCLCVRIMAPGATAWFGDKRCHRRCLARWQDIAGAPRTPETDEFPPLDLVNGTEADPPRKRKANRSRHQPGRRRVLEAMLEDQR